MAQQTVLLVRCVGLLCVIRCKQAIKLLYVRNKTLLNISWGNDYRITTVQASNHFNGSCINIDEVQCNKIQSEMLGTYCNTLTLLQTSFCSTGYRRPTVRSFQSCLKAYQTKPKKQSPLYQLAEWIKFHKHPYTPRFHQMVSPRWKRPTT